MAGCGNEHIGLCVGNSYVATRLRAMVDLRRILTDRSTVEVDEILTDIGYGQAGLVEPKLKDVK
jgi:hypothetical protein